MNKKGVKYVLKKILPFTEFSYINLKLERFYKLIHLSKC